MGESLIDECLLTDLARAHQRHEPPGALMNDLLVQTPQEGRAHAHMAPFRVKRKGQEMGVWTADSGYGDTDQLAGSRDRHDCGLALMEGLDHVGATVGGTRGRPSCVHQIHHVFE